MPDDPQGHEPQPPSEYERIAAQLSDLNKNLGRFAAGVDHRFKQVEGARTPEPPKPPPSVSEVEQLNLKIIDRLGRDTLGFFGDFANRIEQNTLTKVEQQLAERERARQEEEFRSRFWQDFQYYNTDLQAFGPQVMAEFQRLQHLEDPSERANEAAKNVRGLLAQVRADAAEAERRETMHRRQAMFPAGFPVPGMQGGPAPSAPQVDPEVALRDQVEASKQRRAARSWNNINTPEYVKSAQERQSMLRIVRKAS